jgi:hypothetical protein
MTLPTCPPDCQAKHEKNWSATQLALSGVAMLFALIAGIYLYGTATYARAGDVEAMRLEVKEQRGEIRGELKELNLKIDRLIEARGKP